MRIALGFLLCLVLLVAAGAALLFMVAYSIAAPELHLAPVRWTLGTAKRQSVEARAEEVQVPPEFTEEQIRHGFEHFRETCIACHGAPGVSPAELGQGLRPKAPPLAEAAGEWSTAELFWIVKHGIKMTGMPAWGSTHDAEELWSIVAFVERLPAMSPEDYRQLETEVAATEPADAGAEHAAGH